MYKPPAPAAQKRIKKAEGGTLNVHPVGIPGCHWSIHPCDRHQLATTHCDEHPLTRLLEISKWTWKFIQEPGFSHTSVL